MILKNYSALKRAIVFNLLLMLAFSCLNIATAQDGQLDSQFVSDGWLQLPFVKERVYANDLIQQDDNKLLVVGNVWVNEVIRSFSLMRFNQDGTPDLSFGENGVVTDPIDSFADNANKVKLDKAGNIFVMGMSPNMERTAPVIVKYLPNGQRDVSFADSGVFVFQLDSNNYPSDLEVLKDGSILGLGYSNIKGNFDFLVFKITSNGVLDTDFGSNGYVLISPGEYNDFARKIHVSPKGEIIATGGTWNGSDWDYSIVKLDKNGILESTFGNGGSAVFAVGSGNDQSGSSSLLADGSVILAGSAIGKNEGQDFGMVKVSPKGTLDTDFGIGGKVITPVGPGYDAARSVLEMPDEKIVVCGHAWQKIDGDFALVRYHADGKIDETFGIKGLSITDLEGMDNVPVATILGNNNEIFVMGNSYNGTTTSPTLAKYVSGFEVSIEEHNYQMASISVFPNPVGSQLTIQLGAIEPGFYEMRLLDLRGKTVQYYPEVSIEGDQQKLNVELPNGLLPGVYFLEVQGENTFARQTLIKQ